MTAEMSLTAGLPVQIQEAIESWATKTFSDEPFTKLIGMVLTGAALFYRAERGHNPKVKTYADALVYISTCASVGYGDIFAQTETGKLIGTAVMTVGPASKENPSFSKTRARPPS